MLRHTRITRDRIAQFGERFRAFIYPEKVPLRAEVAGPVGRISHDEAQKLTYAPAPLGMRIEPFFSTFWFRLKGEIPAHWAGKRVDLLWISHSEATLWRDGLPVQGLNYEPAGGYNNSVRPDAKLWDKAKAGAVVDLEMEVAANKMFGYDARGLQSYTTLTPFVFEQASIALFDQEAWELYFDFQILSALAQRATPEKLTPWEGYLIESLNAICNVCAADDRSTWADASKRLKKIYAHHNATYGHEVTAVGHAHIDTAWLWPLAETKRKCIRSFSSALAYMEDYPEYKFVCSQAQQYDWMKSMQPELYARMKKAAKKGQWIPVGGTWIEPDCNIPSGESLVRQFLIGQRFFEAEFGARCLEFWNPDVFGYSGALPQIMQGVGIKYFLTQKLSWNQFNKPIHHNFLWEGIDGTRVLTHFPPSDTYNALSNSPVADLIFGVENFKDHDRANESMLLFGYGDGGGGPTKDMLEGLRRVKDLQGIPRTEQRPPQEFFARLEERLTDAPVVAGELYFELHRGTYTSQAANKRDNRFSEHLLREVELLSAVAHKTHGAAYPAEALDGLWKTVLLNQFHDIIPGSSIREVYEDSARDYAEVLAKGRELRAAALTAVGGKTDVLFNACGWERRSLITLESAHPAAKGAQPTHDGKALVAVEMPSLGTAPIVTKAIENAVSASKSGGHYVLENGLVRAEFTAAGLLSRLLDKRTQREVIAADAAGNQFALFDDKPLNYDAWDVDAYHLETRTTLPAATSVKIIESGPARAGLELEIAFGPSSIRQRIFLEAETARLDFECDVEWRHRRQFLKVEFPVAVRAPEATYEIQFGSVKRPTHFNNTYDIARFESCGHRWIDLSQPDYGVAIFTDSKFGYAVHGSLMRISLLRASVHPDPEADQGQHHFRYAVYPHAGDHIAGEVVRRAHEFNSAPLLAKGSDAPVSWFACDSPHLVIDTVKKAENSDAVIVRLYEAHGTSGHAKLRSTLDFKKAGLVNLMEDPLRKLEWEKGEVEVSYRPFQIITLALS